MSRRTRYFTRSICVKGSTLGAPLVRLEHAAFGWTYQGNTYHDDFDGFDDNLRVKHKIYKNYYFTRHKPYTSNFLFMFSEALMNIISFIRRILMPALPVVAIIGGLIWWLVDGDVGKQYFIITGSIYGALIGATLVLAFFGWLWRVVFRIDQKLRDNMEENGYDPDTFNFDEDDMD